ncbi:transcription termination factor 1-like [Cyprinodon tularosa]|nr:transcription termination factor 1-like [Cyprinodon tularosa]
MNIYRNAFNRGAESYSAKIRLINTLYHSAVEDAADINWEEIAETVGTMSPWGIQRIFTRLKVRKVPHFQSLSFGEIMDFLYHHLVPVLQEKLSSCRKKEQLQEQQQQDRYQLSDIFNSDVEDEDNS